MSLRAAALLCASVLIPLSAVAAEKPLTPAQRQEIVRTLTGLEEKWIGVWSTRDVSVLEELLAEDFVATTSTGAVRTKAEHIAGYREDLKIYYAVENNEMLPHIVTSTMAVFTGRDTTHSRDAQGAEVVEHFRWTDTWLLRNGQWQCVATHETQLSAEQAQVPGVSLPPELARVLTDYEAAWASRNAAALAALFAEDGFVLSNGAPPVRGRAAIEKAYTGSGGPLVLHAFAFATEGSLGYILGGFSRHAGEPDVGKFTLTLRKGAGGRWLIVSDMDNGNQPGR